jgi:hypothetical protein
MYCKLYSHDGLLRVTSADVGGGVLAGPPRMPVNDSQMPVRDIYPAILKPILLEQLVYTAFCSLPG